ncbi:MAG: flavodoxin [Muribaculaceae bacterium]|nr:flavodoxin [Muribaculaceae bacterium]
MKRILLSLAVLISAIALHAKTLVVYYSYTNNVHSIITELTKQIDADVVRIEPAEKGLDYAANNYAIGSAQISAIRNNPDEASSYPAIDPVNVNLAEYDCVIIGAPLWWSNMAAPLQTYLFQNGKAMAGKKIELIVSSASSGISGVEGDAKRLIPDGDFLSPSLWIRSSQTSNAASLISEWLKTTGYDTMTGVEEIQAAQNNGRYSVFSISGTMVAEDALSMQTLEKGLYIVNGKKVYIK